MRHYHGFYSEESRKALQRHDERLGQIIKTLKENNIYEESTIIVLGDHSSLDDYTTIFMALGKGIKSGVVIENMNLVDEGPTMAKLLGFELENIDGEVIEEFLQY